MNTLLQPDDSKRVTEALLKKIEDADFNIAFDVGFEVGVALNPERTGGLGGAIVSAIDKQVGRSIESCLGSKEMGDVVAKAIREGMEGMNV